MKKHMLSSLRKCLILILILSCLLIMGCNSGEKGNSEATITETNIVGQAEVNGPKIIGKIDESSGEINMEEEINQTEIIDASTAQTEGSSNTEEVKTAKISINGDHLMHDIVIWSGYNPETDTYDFNNNYEETKTLTEKMDLAIGNYEGSINPDLPLSGYPLFNAPPEVADALKNAGYDMVSLANNHIADSGAAGIYTTVEYFENLGVDAFGVNLPGRDSIKIKEVNGIKLAFLNYSYGFNGMEGALSAEDQSLLSWLDPVRIEQDIKQAKQMADAVIVMPHMGIEYQLLPNQEQIDLFHAMVDWGADLVVGNHPHVIQPIEIYNDTFILYSMGNFISNQRVETGLDIWTERGVILEFDFEKQGDGPAKMVDYTLHPTWVSRVANGQYDSVHGYALYDYQVLLAENHLDNEYIKQAYDEVIDHMENGMK